MFAWWSSFLVNELYTKTDEIDYVWIYLYAFLYMIMNGRLGRSDCSLADGLQLAHHRWVNHSRTF